MQVLSTAGEATDLKCCDASTAALHNVLGNMAQYTLAQASGLSCFA